MRVGVAGVGRMGAAIAARLIEVGHEVTVYCRDRSIADDSYRGMKRVVLPALRAEIHHRDSFAICHTQNNQLAGV